MIKYESIINKYLYNMSDVEDIINTIGSNNYYGDNCTREKVSVVLEKLEKFISNIKIERENAIVGRKETEEEAREYFGEDFINQFNALMTRIDKEQAIMAIHGTNPANCPSIMEEGLKYKSPALTSTAVLQQMNYGKKDIEYDEFTELLNWPHKEYKGLVLVAVPYESFYKEGLWNHYQESENSYYGEQDYKIDPEFIVGYIDVENKKIIENPKYNRDHDYSGLEHDFELFREKKGMTNERLIEEITEVESEFRNTTYDYSYEPKENLEEDVENLPYTIEELIGTFNSVRYGFPDGMSEERYKSLMEELDYKMDMFHRCLPLLKTEVEVNESRRELEDMFNSSETATSNNEDFDLIWDDDSLWDVGDEFDKDEYNKFL